MFAMFPAEKRIVPQIVYGMAAMLAPSIGPTIGGYLTESLSWHWLFLVNLVPGLIVSTLVWNLVRIDRPMPELLRLIDLRGLFYMALFLGCTEYALDEGPRHDWFGDDAVALTATVAAVSAVLFFHRAFTAAHPIVDLRAFANRNFAVGTVLVTAIGLCMYTLVYLTPLFLGSVRGYNSLQIGEVMMTQGLAMFFSAPLAGRLTRVIGIRTMLAIGIINLSLGTALCMNVTADWGFWQFALPQVLRGNGLLFCMFPMTNIALGTLPVHELKNASGLFNVMRNIGGAIGLALINTLINARSWLHWQMLGESVRDDRPAVREALGGMAAAARNGIGGDGAQAGTAMLMHQMQQQVAVQTFGDLFLMLALMMATTMLLLPLIEKPRNEVPAEAAH
jgi:DHA2 family multidrug resistance protein